VESAEEFRQQEFFGFSLLGGQGKKISICERGNPRTVAFQK
jgi:hypothetical protein